jgi:hypothetical protein
LPAEDRGGDVAVRVDELNHQGFSPNFSTTREYCRHPSLHRTTMASQRGEEQQQESVTREKKPLIEKGLTSFATRRTTTLMA